MKVKTSSDSIYPNIKMNKNLLNSSGQKNVNHTNTNSHTHTLSLSLSHTHTQAHTHTSTHAHTHLLTHTRTLHVSTEPSARDVNQKPNQTQFIKNE